MRSKADEDKIAALERIYREVHDVFHALPKMDRTQRLIVGEAAAAFNEIFERDFQGDAPTALIGYLQEPTERRLEWYQQTKRFLNTLDGPEALGYAMGFSWISAVNIHTSLEDSYADKLVESIFLMYFDIVDKANSKKTFAEKASLLFSWARKKTS